MRREDSGREGPEPDLVRRMAEDHLRDAALRASRLEPGGPPESIDPTECFELLVVLGRLTQDRWTAAGLPREFIRSLSRSVSSLTLATRKAIETNSWFPASAERGIARELDALEDSLRRATQSLASSLEELQGVKSEVELRNHLAWTAQEIDAYVLFGLDRVEYACAMAKALGVALSGDLTRRVHAAEEAVRSLLSTLGPVFEAAEDSLYPVHTERTPPSFWWRRKPR